jgi:branched-chain amino acid transport system substrate-binding protein
VQEQDFAKHFQEMPIEENDQWRNIMTSCRSKALKWIIGAASALVLAANGSSASAQDSVTIGFTGPLSGGAALYGKNTLTGLEMAAKEINQAGGFKVGDKTYTINVVALDDKYSPSEAAVNAKRLRTQYNAPVIFTPHSGGVFALQAFNEQDNFLIGAYTSVPKAADGSNKLTFRIPPSFLGYMDPFIKVTMGKSGKKLGMAGADHDYAKVWAQIFSEAWKKAGGTIVSESPMSYNKDTDFYSGVSRVLSASPDVMFVGGASEPTSLVIRQARELGFQGSFVVMDQAKLDEMARVLGGFEHLENAVGVLPLIYDQREGAHKFVERFRKEQGRDPGSEISYNYASLNAVASAMQLAGTVSDSRAIRGKLDAAFKALPESKNPSPITGVDEKGGSNARLLVGVVKNGKVETNDGL